MKFNIRLLYLYLFSFVSLLIVIIGSIKLLNLGLKAWFFKDADNYARIETAYLKSIDEKISTEEAQKREAEMIRADEINNKRQKQREASDSIAMIVIGLPVYLMHWKLAQKENSSN